ncbi:WhiB family transcriptional regulator [Streptomyces niveus]|uniref:WhiB family transcriptional regulator n=1 Tax=Streptomyces niveus TaxID=193462 RepID=UPI003450AC5E
MLSLNARGLVRGGAPAGGVAACTGVDPDLFFPEASDAAGPASAAERAALAVCAGCPVRDWCLDRELDECTVASRIQGVRGGLRQADRRALHARLFGRRARNGAPR